MSLASKGMNRGLIAGMILLSDRRAAARPVESESADQAAVSAALAKMALVAALATDPNAACVRKETRPASFAAASGERLSSSMAVRICAWIFSFLAAVRLSVTPSADMQNTPWTTCSFAGRCALDFLVRNPSAAKRSWKESMADSPRMASSRPLKSST